MSAREDILRAAERVFATYGYEGASMKRIADQAGVAQALLHYHFQNKDNLYAAIFERRSSAINVRREKLLEELLDAGPEPSLEDVLKILLFPAQPETNEDQSDYNMFQQLVSASTVANDERSKALMARYYDPIARRFIDAIRSAVPGLSLETAVWAYLFALGARMQASAPADRPRRLSGSRVSDGQGGLALLLPFVAAGIRAVAQSEPDRAAGGSRRRRVPERR
jgi:AcrR family transcriptional regulator